MVPDVAVLVVGSLWLGSVSYPQRHWLAPGLKARGMKFVRGGSRTMWSHGIGSWALYTIIYMFCMTPHSVQLMLSCVHCLFTAVTRIKIAFDDNCTDHTAMCSQVPPKLLLRSHLMWNVRMCRAGYIRNWYTWLNYWCGSDKYCIP